jgi:hypothetical protein
LAADAANVGGGADPARKPLELGTFAHFLQAAIHSQERRERCALLGCFLKLASNWTGSHWILEPKGLHDTLALLTRKFRNRAAHIDELDQQEYIDCRKLSRET